MFQGVLVWSRNHIIYFKLLKIDISAFEPQFNCVREIGWHIRVVKHGIWLYHVLLSYIKGWIKWQRAPASPKWYTLASHWEGKTSNNLSCLTQKTLFSLCYVHILDNTTNVTPSFIFHRSIFSDFFFNTKFRIHSHINTAQHRCVLNAFSGHLGWILGEVLEIW